MALDIVDDDETNISSTVTESSTSSSSLSSYKSAWIGSELSKTPELWTTNLSKGKIAEIKDCVRVALEFMNPSTTTTTASISIGALTKEQCPLPTLERDLLPQVKLELTNGIQGLGFHVIRGVPVREFTKKENEVFFWCLGLHLGITGAQDNNGLLLGHVRDTGADPTTTRQYKTNAFIDFHCDAADVVGLLCLQPATQGGLSRIVSSVSVLLEFQRRFPHLVKYLSEPRFFLDTRGSGGVNAVPVEMVRRDSHGVVRTFYHKEYFRTWVQYSEFHDNNNSNNIAPQAIMDPIAKQVLDAYDSILEEAVQNKSLTLEMDFEPGDIQLISNHFILHSRTAYTDDTTEEDNNNNKRHLLRLWVSMPQQLSWQDKLSKYMNLGQIASRFARAKVRGRWYKSATLLD